MIPNCRHLVDGILHVNTLDPLVKSGLDTIYMIMVCGFYYIDGLQTALSGAIRGTGQQQKGARICVLAYWIAGIPAAVVLGFAIGLKSTGLWLGMMVGPFVQMVMYAKLLLQLDWHAIAATCEQRLNPVDEDNSVMGA